MCQYMSLQMLFWTATLDYLCAFMFFETTAAKCNWINARGESHVPFGSCWYQPSHAGGDSRMAGGQPCSCQSGACKTMNYEANPDLDRFFNPVESESPVIQPAAVFSCHFLRGHNDTHEVSLLTGFSYSTPFT